MLLVKFGLDLIPLRIPLCLMFNIMYQSFFACAKKTAFLIIDFRIVVMNSYPH